MTTLLLNFGILLLLLLLCLLLVQTICIFTVGKLFHETKLHDMLCVWLNGLLNTRKE